VNAPASNGRHDALGSIRTEARVTAPEGWDAYIERHPRASAYHRAAAVGIGARAFGLRTTFVSARNARAELVGVLPLVEQSSALFGRFLVSLPFVTYGGILADDAAVASALGTLAVELARERRADHLELRHTEPWEASGLAERLDKVSMVLALPDSPETLSQALGAKLRSQIRRAERESLEIVWDEAHGPEALAAFYRVFAPAMRDLGTPVYPRRFFRIACEALHGLSSVLVVRSGGVPQAAAIVVRHGRTIEVPWAAATVQAKRTAVNMRMYWELLSYAIRSGAHAFDFGRSTVDSGTYRFKAQWGAEPKQLHWHYWLAADAPLPKLNPSNPKYARAAALWRRLPLWCANLLGPHIVRHLP